MYNKIMYSKNNLSMYPSDVWSSEHRTNDIRRTPNSAASKGEKVELPVWC